MNCNYFTILTYLNGETINLSVKYFMTSFLSSCPVILLGFTVVVLLVVSACHLLKGYAFVLLGPGKCYKILIFIFSLKDLRQSSER